MSCVLTQQYRPIAVAFPARRGGEAARAGAAAGLSGRREDELPTDLQGIGEALASRLQALDAAGAAVLVVIDAVNELDSGRALAWLPRVVPARVQLLFSAISQGGEAGDGDGRGSGAGGGEGLSMSRDDAVSEVLGSMRTRWGLGGDGREGVYQVVSMQCTSLIHADSSSSIYSQPIRPTDTR